jgi:TonB family protein
MSLVMNRFLFLSLTLHLVVIAIWDPSMRLSQPSSRTIHVALHQLPIGENSESQSRFHVTNDHVKSTNREPSLKRHQKLLKKPSEKRISVHKANTTGRKNQDNPLPKQKTGSLLSGATTTSNNVAKPAMTNTTLFTVIEKSTAEKNRLVADNHLRRGESSLISKTKIVNYLQQQLAQYFSYPYIAVKRGWQGTVLLQFRIEANGDIKKIHIQKSSGYSILDRSAIKSLSRVGRIPIADWLDNTVTNLELPVEFKFNEG